MSLRLSPEVGRCRFGFSRSRIFRFEIDGFLAMLLVRVARNQPISISGWMFQTFASCSSKT